MRINQNISAMNTYSRLTSANNSKSGSLAKLSSGLRINKAGDDAAGLAISEKMRGQVGGLKQATRNAQDGISLIQTAEGALNETHSILKRMRDLAVQSSNDTNTQSDRLEIQKEIDQLAKEVTRISDTTEFNTQNLLGGGFKAKLHIGANKDQNMELEIANMGAEALKVTGFEYKTQEVSDLNLDARSLTGDKITISIAPAQTASGDAIEKTTAKYNETTKTITVTLAQAEGTGSGVGDISVSHDDIYKALESVAGKADIVFTKQDDFKGTDTVTAGGSSPLTVISGAWVENEATKGKVGISVSTQSAANAAISVLDEATAKVSEERSKLGSVQNRLEHTINNLTATAENLSAAESRIRDVDMAEEMMEFTKNNILSQAATSMLAQANQMPQSVLQLLQ